MINSIYAFAISIAATAIVVTILEMVLPDGNTKKYVRLVIGVYLMFVIINPVIENVGNIGNMFDKIEIPQEEIETSKELKVQKGKDVHEIYTENIKKDIINRLKSNGYIVEIVMIDINKEEKDYGLINKVEIKVVELGENSVKTVEKIEIGKKETEENKMNLTNKQIEEIKNIVSTNYGINNKNIIVT